MSPVTKNETRLIVAISAVCVAALLALAFLVGTRAADILAAVAAISALSAAGVLISAYLRAVK
ncbi:hypothetical protein [Asanoa ferruginea]|nr:hypothetical protein [Asanoa ferruginea]